MRIIETCEDTGFFSLSLSISRSLSHTQRHTYTHTPAFDQNFEKITSSKWVAKRLCAINLSQGRTRAGDVPLAAEQ